MKLFRAFGSLLLSWVFFSKAVLFAILTPTAYVANLGDNTVSVIDLGSNQVIALIHVGASPAGMAITPDNTTLYVCNSGTTTITPVAIPSNSVGTNINGFNSPVDIAITPEGTLAYVMDSGTNTVIPFSIPANTLGAPIVGPAPGFNFSDLDVLIAITPDGKTAYVSDEFNSRIVPISIPSNAVGIPIAVGANPLGLAISPSGTKLYVTVGSAVKVINISTNTLETTINDASFTTANCIAITPDGKTAYVTNSGAVPGTVTVIDISGATPVVTAVLTVGSGPTSVAISPDGKTAYVANSGDNTVSPIAIPSNVVGTPIPVGAVPIFLTIGPSVLGPNQLTGKQKKNDFAIESELFNKLTWQPSSSPNVVLYKIFRNGTLIGQVAANEKLEFQDHNREKGVSYTYNVIAVSGNGTQSQTAIITVP